MPVDEQDGGDRRDLSERFDGLGELCFRLGLLQQLDLCGQSVRRFGNFKNRTDQVEFRVFDNSPVIGIRADAEPAGDCASRLQEIFSIRLPNHVEKALGNRLAEWRLLVDFRASSNETLSTFFALQAEYLPLRRAVCAFVGRECVSVSTALVVIGPIVGVTSHSSALIMIAMNVDILRKLYVHRVCLAEKS